MTRFADRDLMLFHDGELSEKDAQRLAKLVAEDPYALRMLREVEFTGDALRVWAGAHSNRADDIADRVMDRIQAEPRPMRARRPRRKMMAALAGGLALAAGVGLILVGVSSDRRQTNRSSGLDPSPSSALDRVAEAAEAAFGADTDSDEFEPSATIERVDFGGTNGTIILVSASDDAVTPVVWVADDPDSPADDPDSDES